MQGAPDLKSTENIYTDDKRLHALLASGKWYLSIPGVSLHPFPLAWLITLVGQIGLCNATKCHLSTDQPSPGLLVWGSHAWDPEEKAVKNAAKGGNTAGHCRFQAMPKIYNCYSICKPKISLFLDTSKKTIPPFLLWHVRDSSSACRQLTDT